MADEVDGALEQLTERLVQLADTIAENSGPAAKVAWDVSMAAIQLEAIAYLGVGCLCAAIAAVACRAGVKSLRHATKDGIEEADAVLSGIGATAAMFVTIAFATAAAINLFTVQNWVTAFSPEAGMALRILNGL